jgi:hypothetical protein
MELLDIPTLVQERYGMVAKKQGREYHSPCPDCGGRDRMVWYGDDKGNGFCRQCLKTFWLTDLKQLDPLERLALEQQARANMEREKQMQAQNLKTWQEKQAYRQGWNDALSYAAREWWHTQGIGDESISRYELGYRKYPIENARTGERLSLDAYTIPIHDPDTWDVVNMQYRLINAPPTIGKYRQASGIPARSFYARPHTGGDVVIVEGAKKAIVLNQLLEDSIQVVGLPGITPSERLIDELSGYKRKWFLPDPDVQDGPIHRLTSILDNVHVVRLPVKPDDAVTGCGMGKQELRRWMQLYR